MSLTRAPVRQFIRYVLLSAVLFALAGCAQQRIRDQATGAVEAGNHEAAVKILEDGTQIYPDSSLLRSGLIQAKEAVLARRLAEAASLRAAGKLDEAKAAFVKAKAFDVSGSRVASLIQDVERQIRLRDAVQQVKGLLDKGDDAQALVLLTNALKDQPKEPELLALQRKLELKARQGYASKALTALVESHPISLDFRDASLRMVLDVVSRNSGINFIFDKDLRPEHRVTVLLRNVQVEDAIDLIVSTHQLSKKVIDQRTVLIYPNTPEKQREHQEQVIKVFYLSSAEAKGAAAFLKSMLKVKDPFIDDRANMLAIRESAETVQMAERLISLYDSLEPEVLMDVEVIEVSSSRLTQLGIKFPDTFALTPLTAAGSSSGLTLGNVQGINADRIGLSASGLMLYLKREVGDVNVLANPKIRAKNKEKAKIMIGDKIPVITATVSTGGFVSDSVNYVDVGLKLEVEPTVFVDDEVNIKVSLEVSSLGNATKTSSGTQAYQIGTRNASTMLRLRDGETQLLAGLISREDRANASRVPGAGDIPVLGRLFSAQQDDTKRTELVLAITPRIIRNQRYPELTQTEMLVGTEAQPKFRNPGVVNLKSRSAPTGDESANSEGAPEASNLPVLSWKAPSEVKVGDTFELALNLKSGVLLRGTPVQISYPREMFTAVAVSEGTYFSQGGSTTSFTQSIEAELGRVNAGIIRLRDEGTAGNGSVVTIKFTALNSGQGTITLTGFDGVGLTDKQRPQLPVAVQLDVK